MEKFMQWVCDTLKNGFGPDLWLSAAGWICVSILAIFLVTIICLSVKCVKLNKRLSESQSCRNAAIKDVENLSRDKEDLEQTIKFVKNELEKEKLNNEDLITQLKLEREDKALVKNDLEQLKYQIEKDKEAEKSKRLEAAKKAVETRKRNIEAKNQELTEVKSVDTDSVINTETKTKNKKKNSKK